MNRLLPYLIGLSLAAPLAQAQDWEVERPLGSPEVIERYREILERDPASQQGLDGILREYQARGGLTALIDDYASRVAQSPDDAGLHLVLARLQARNHEPEAALALVDRAIELGWSRREAFLLRGQLRGELGMLDAAVEDFEQALGATESSEERIDVLRALGDLYLTLGRTDEALEAYQRITEAAPRDRYVWQELAQVLYDAGFRAESLAALQQVVELSGSNSRVRAESLREVGALQEELALWPQAAETWWRLRELLTDASWLRREAEEGLLRTYRGWGQIHELLARLDRELERGTRDRFTLTARARILTELGRATEAREAYALAVDRLGLDREMGIEYAAALTAWGAPDEARALLDELVARYPGDFELVTALAEQRLQQGAPFDASFLLRSQEDHWWNRPSELWGLFDLYTRIGDQTAADRVARRIGELSPDDQRPLVRLAEANFVAGRAEAGRAAIESVRGTDDADVLISAVELLQEYGYAMESVAWIDEARHRFPDDPRFALAWMRSVASRDVEMALSASREVLLGMDDWDAIAEAFELYVSRLREALLVDWALRAWADEFDRHPTNHRVGRLLLMLQVSAGEPSSASATLTRLRAIAPDTAHPDEWVLQTLERWPDPAALPLLHRLADADPASAWRYGAIGARLLVQAGRVDEARIRLDELRAEAAGRPPVLFEIAEAYLTLPRTGDQQTACDLMATVLDAEPRNIEYRIGLADCLYATGKPSAAFEVAVAGLSAVRDVDSAAALLDRALRTIPPGTSGAALTERLRTLMADRSATLQSWLESHLQALGMQ